MSWDDTRVALQRVPPSSRAWLRQFASIFPPGTLGFSQIFTVVLNLLGTVSRAPLGTEAGRCSSPTCEMSYKA